MSMTDPIADMLTRVRNAVLARHPKVVMPGSKMKAQIAEILKHEGFIEDYSVADDQGAQAVLDIRLKWLGEQPAIEGLLRLSRPGQRRYAHCTKIPKVRNGLGILIVSTSKGIMTDRAARKAGLGGELICSVW